ncbi:hypothetical protein PR003_g760 [Phytophthora rubi]|uniref:Cystatin domain-containing protein n=1 Tax=Phytophthora rubi TaxID=129364 RepID=A0A6A3P3M4_9STRA|nr:hypothetical protein PR002_g580 [Phytophthora rubi]KAE9052410.1 hypothetical protein PR001_g523 [Phytophthora rubi]KAE9359389.1 hypothetical protein PR003_g760 [Phytophthora rubi]
MLRYLLLLLTGVTTANALLAGGWSVTAVTPDTRAALVRALSKTNVCVKSILWARSQVVAGMNYEFHIDGCRGAHGGECGKACKSPRRFSVVVFDQPWTHTTIATSVSES